MGSSHSTQLAAQRKQEERERLVRKAEDELGLASEHPDDKVYLSASLPDLVDALRDGNDGWTAERVCQAYIRKACAAHRKTNCLTEILFDEALADARAKDESRRQTGRVDGVFWGVPCSFKDTYNILGVDSSLGCSKFCFDPTVKPDDEATLVKLYRRSGGIPFCKTNVPQTLLSFECANPIFGATSNPFDSTRTCGGSSGGEAALVTLGGTPLGWGSDIGGSLRIPAAYSGCCGLKPSRGRWSAQGNRKVVFGFEGIRGVVGPMARTASDLQYMSRAMLGLVANAREAGEMVDDYIIPVSWKEVEVKRLKIGYWVESGLVKTSPACARAVLETVEKLKKAGHEVELFTPPDALEAMKVFVALTSAEGYKQLRSCLGPDPMEPSMQLVMLGSRIPAFVRSLLCWVARNLVGDSLTPELLAVSGPKSVGEVWQWTNRRDEYTARFNKSAWEAGYDVLICPAQAVPALEHGKTQLLSPLAAATILFNVLDLTVGVLPVTRVDAALDAAPADFTKGSTGARVLEDRVYGGGRAYDAARMHGLPVGVQVVGRQWDEERVLAAMRVVEDVAGYA